MGGGLGKGIEADWIKIHAPAAAQLVEFTYDGLGKRVAKSVNGTITKYIYDRHSVIEEYNSSSNLQKSYVFSLNIDEVLQCTNYQPSAVNYYFNHDHLGSVVDITDESGSLIEQYEYDPFGKLRIIDPATSSLRSESIIGNSYTFTGRRWDPEIGLYYYRARYYDPVVGRFISADPIGYAAGMNLYVYVNNNPLNWIDPWGLAPKPKSKIHTKVTYITPKSLTLTKLKEKRGPAKGFDGLKELKPLGKGGCGTKKGGGGDFTIGGFTWPYSWKGWAGAIGMGAGGAMLLGGTPAGWAVLIGGAIFTLWDLCGGLNQADDFGNEVVENIIDPHYNDLDELDKQERKINKNWST